MTHKYLVGLARERCLKPLVVPHWCCVTVSLTPPSTGNNIHRILHTAAFFQWCPRHTGHTSRRSCPVYTDIFPCHGHTGGTRIPRDCSHTLEVQNNTMNKCELKANTRSRRQARETRQSNSAVTFDTRQWKPLWLMITKSRESARENL